MKFLLFSVLIFGIIGANNLTLSQLPVANFTATPLSVCQGQPVTFTNTSSNNGGPAITQYSWDFGDGFSDQIPNPVHTYNTPGTYSVTLTVTNANGQADFELKTAYIIVKPAPTASFSVNGLGCTVPLTVSFTNTGSSGTNFTYSWNFGNSQTSNSATPPSQTYTSAGTYNVSLTVTNVTSGCVTNITEPLVVSNFQAGMTLPTVACVDQQVDILDNSTAGANVWNWNITPSTGVYVNGTSSSSQNPSLTFSTPGTYTIQLLLRIQIQDVQVVLLKLLPFSQLRLQASLQHHLQTVLLPMLHLITPLLAEPLMLGLLVILRLEQIIPQHKLRQPTFTIIMGLMM